eukprot:1125746-Prymnesium_polylepis.1
MLLRESDNSTTSVLRTCSYPSVAVSVCQLKQACALLCWSTCTKAISMPGHASRAMQASAPNPGSPRHSRPSMSVSPE